MEGSGVDMANIHCINVRAFKLYFKNYSSMVYSSKIPPFIIFDNRVMFKYYRGYFISTLKM